MGLALTERRPSPSGTTLLSCDGSSDQCAFNMTASTRPLTEQLSPDADGIARAVGLLADGRLVAFPTETVYGLGADGRSGRAVAALYAAKGRPAFNPLIAHVPDLEAASVEGRFGDDAMRLAEVFWPGPLTLVVPCPDKGRVCDLARAGLNTIGLRAPAHHLARAILKGCGFPVVAPSANLSGRISPTEASDVLCDLDGRIDAVVMGDRTEVGLESTIVSCLGDGPRLLRPGGIPRDALERVLARPLLDPAHSPQKPVAPGALTSHYAPRAAVRLDVDRVLPEEALLTFGGVRPAGLEGARAMRDLSPNGDLAEAAANLFGYLRFLDSTGAGVIAVTPIPDHGLGEAINDRLRRAAAGR